MIICRHSGLTYTVTNAYSNISCCSEQLRVETSVTLKKQAVKSCNKGEKKKKPQLRVSV